MKMNANKDVDDLATNDGQTDGRTNRRTNGRTDGRTDRRTNGQTDGRTDGQTDGRTNERGSYCRSCSAGWVEPLALFIIFYCKCLIRECLTLKMKVKVLEQWCHSMANKTIHKRHNISHFYSISRRFRVINVSIVSP